MEGKIVLEEHWATESVLAETPGLSALPDRYRSQVEDGLLDTRELRLAEMDRHGIEFAILSLTAPGIQGILEPDQAIADARQLNDTLAAEVAARPTRFAGFAALPMQDPKAAAEELTRCVEELGFKGALVNGFTQKNSPDTAIYYDVPQYRSFWAVLDALDVPFYLHPRAQIPARAQAYEDHPWLLGAAWGFARETSIHALRLIGSGLFDEFPRLQIILGHLGERIPYDIWRIDHVIGRNSPGYRADKSVHEYMRANFHLTTSGHFDDLAFHCAVAQLGMERMMFSIDYPFEVMSEAASWFDNVELTDADRLAVGRGNANELFKLELQS